MPTVAPTPTIWQRAIVVAIQMATSSEIACQPPEPERHSGEHGRDEDRGAAHEAPAQLVGGEPVAVADVLADEVGEHVGHPRRNADAGHELEAVAVGDVRGRHEGQCAEDQHRAVGRGGDEVGRPLARHPAQAADEAGHGRSGQPRRCRGGVDRAPTVPSAASPTPRRSAGRPDYRPSWRTRKAVQAASTSALCRTYRRSAWAGSWGKNIVSATRPAACARSAVSFAQLK